MHRSLAPNHLIRERRSPLVSVAAIATAVLALFEVEKREGCNESHINPVVIDTKNTNISVVIHYIVGFNYANIMQTAHYSILNKDLLINQNLFTYYKQIKWANPLRDDLCKWP